MSWHVEIRVAMMRDSCPAARSCREDRLEAGHEDVDPTSESDCGDEMATVDVCSVA